MNKQAFTLAAGLLMSLIMQGTLASATTIKSLTSLANISGYSVVIVQQNSSDSSVGNSKDNNTASLTSGTIAKPRIIPATPALTPARTPVIVSSALPISTPVSIPVVVSTPVPIVTSATPGVAGTPSPVPLPGALPLLLGSLGALGFVRLRKKSA